MGIFDSLVNDLKSGVQAVLHPIQSFSPAPVIKIPQAQQTTRVVAAQKQVAALIPIKKTVAPKTPPITKFTYEPPSFVNKAVPASAIPKPLPVQPSNTKKITLSDEAAILKSILQGTARATASIALTAGKAAMHVPLLPGLPSPAKIFNTDEYLPKDIPTNNSKIGKAVFGGQDVKTLPGYGAKTLENFGAPKVVTGAVEKNPFLGYPVGLAAGVIDLFNPTEEGAAKTVLESIAKSSSEKKIAEHLLQLGVAAEDAKRLAPTLVDVAKADEVKQLITPAVEDAKLARQTARQSPELAPPAGQTSELPAGSGRSPSLSQKENVSLPNTNTEVPVNGSGKLERGFVSSVQEAKAISPETKAGVAGTYTSKTNDVLMGEAKALLTEGAKVDLKSIKNGDQKVAATIQEAINLDKAGNHDAAAALYNNLSEAGTEAGRTVHAFSLLDQMSPEAIAISAAGKIKKYNLTAFRKIPELTGDQAGMISDAVARIRDMEPGRLKNIEINKLSETINNFIPSSITDKIITTWKAGLLTSLRTTERNLLGNTAMGLAEGGKDVIANEVDRVMSKFTGKRTLTATTKGSGRFADAVTRQQVLDIVRTGFDPENLAKFEVRKINWGKNPVEQALKKYTDVVFNTLGAEDKPFWNASYGRSLYDQAGAEAINAGKKGDKAFIQSLVEHPTEEMLATAAKDANYATFHDENKISGLAKALKREAGKKWYTKLPAEIIAPFTGVPSSIVGKTVAYSPIGLVKGAVDVGRVIAGSEVPGLQRAAAQEIGRGVVGTGLFGLGAYLMSKGLMTGQPKDATEAAQWALEGKQANSVLIGGKWRSINSIGPQSLVILSGAKLQEEMNKPDGSVANYGFGLAQDQLNQTFLAGVQQPLQAITDPARYGTSYAGNLASSFVPNIVKDTSKAFDPNARETNTIADYIQSAIPGLRNKLLPKRDALGNVIKQEPSGPAAYYDLLNSKTPINNSVVKELTRLNESGNNATPAKLTKDQTINKQKVILTPKQLNDLNGYSGEVVQKQLAALFETPEYKGLTDEQKAKEIDNVVSSVRSQYKDANPTGDFKPATEQLQNVGDQNLVNTLQIKDQADAQARKDFVTAIESKTPKEAANILLDDIHSGKVVGDTEIKNRLDAIQQQAIRKAKNVTISATEKEAASLGVPQRADYILAQMKQSDKPFKVIADLQKKGILIKTVLDEMINKHGAELQSLVNQANKVKAYSNVNTLPEVSSITPTEAKIIYPESGGKTTAQNPGSTAFGLGQLLKANRVKYGKELGIDPDTTNPQEQLAMFRAYIKDRYGSPEKALAFRRVNNWY